MINRFFKLKFEQEQEQTKNYVELNDEDDYFFVFFIWCKNFQQYKKNLLNRSFYILNQLDSMEKIKYQNGSMQKLVGLKMANDFILRLVYMNFTVSVIDEY